MARLLLDVDGVINAIDPPPPQAEGWGEYRSIRCGFPVRYAPGVVGAVRAWLLAGVDVRWLTTWEGMANAELAPAVGLPRLPVMERRPESPLGWWKLDAARRLYAEDPAPFAWVDDDLRYVPEAQAWIASLDGQALGLAPVTEAGLSPAGVAEVGRFLLGPGPEPGPSGASCAPPPGPLPPPPGPSGASPRPADQGVSPNPNAP